MKKTVIVLFLVFLLFSCVSNQPDDEVSSVYISLGDAYFRLEEYGSAIDAYKTAVLYLKDKNEVLYNLSRAYLANHQPGEALAVAESMLKEDPGNGILIELTSYILFSSGKYEEALNGYALILEEVSNHPNSLYNSSLIYNKLEDYELAFSFLKLYFEAIEETDDDLKKLAEFAELAGDFESVVKYNAILSERGSADAAGFLANYYFGTEQFDLALPYFLQVESSSLEAADVSFQIAWIYLFAVEDFKLGTEYLKKSAEKGSADFEKVRGRMSEGDYLWQADLSEFLIKLQNK